MLFVFALIMAMLTFGSMSAQAENSPAQRTVQVAENMEPVIPHPAQTAEANKKLAALGKKFGRKPNILILLVDDMGWGDPGCYGGGEAIGAPTPQIDRLATEGLRLTSAYAQPMCSPTRATLMTGRLPIHHGIHRAMDHGEPGGLTGEITIAQLLNETGYRTALVGKWHLGEAEEQQPQHLGYDEFFGFLGVCDQYTEWRDPAIMPEIANKPEMRELLKDVPFNHNLVTAKKGEKLQRVKEITIPVLANLDQEFADYSVDFIKRSTKQDKPFFLIHAFSKVHYDNYPADGYAGKSPSGFPYKDAVIEVDDIVGRIIETLKETGQAENTLVFLSSDNGPEEDAFPDCGHTPFRGAKGTTWEGGVRVPGIAWWPGTIKAGRVSNGLFDLADLFTTSLALGGAMEKLPKDRYIDGIDQTSFLITDNGDSMRSSIFYWHNYELAALRWHHIKLHLLLFLSQNPLRESKTNSILQKASLVWANDLNIDPKERFSALERHTPRYVWAAPFILEEFMRYKEVLEKYPPKASQVATE